LQVSDNDDEVDENDADLDNEFNDEQELLDKLVTDVEHDDFKRLVRDEDE